MKRSTVQSGTAAASIIGGAALGGALGSVALGLAFGVGLGAVVAFALRKKPPAA